jgi:hypothetical protein
MRVARKSLQSKLRPLYCSPFSVHSANKMRKSTIKKHDFLSLTHSNPALSRFTTVSIDRMTINVTKENVMKIEPFRTAK